MDQDEVAPEILSEIQSLLYQDSWKLTSEEAHQEALKRIEYVISTQAVSLELNDLPLTKVPNEIGNCVSLETLKIQGKWILSSDQNRLTALPGSIGKLTRLVGLFVSRNILSKLPNSIGKLSNLEFLDLSQNKLKQLPTSIGDLSKLSLIDLASNELSSLPDSIGQLSNLRTLIIKDNSLTKLPESIGRLSDLEQLDLRNNQLTSVPQSLTSLKNLIWLDLRGNPKLLLPPELIEAVHQPERLLTYLRAKVEERSRPLHEAKIILVGQGGVGKTSLIQRLVFGRYRPGENATKGIQINHWSLSLVGNLKGNKIIEEIHTHLWDFGGQEIMHATHQFFLTHRALYLLVLDARQGERESRVEYWLALIQSFAGASPVLVIINKSDQYHLDINRRGLQQKYPNIVGFVRTSAATGDGIEELQNKIQDTLAQLPHLDTPFPQSWWQVKEQLETLQKQQDFLPYQEYRQLCQTNGLNDDIQQRTLIGFLHDLGIALNFDDDRVRDTNILNPEWVTQGVYALITSPQLAQKRGILARRQVGELLDPVRYPPERQGFILRMMEKFELAYPLDNGTGYLVPDLLSVEEPVFTWDNGDALHFVYHYHVLPYSILHRLIVRQHDKICETIAWRTGVMLAYEGMKALIKADIEDGKIHIAITGKGRRREFLGMLRFTFASIHQNLTGTKPEEHVPIPGYPGITIPYTFLLELENENEAFTRWPGVTEKINVQALLGTIETPVIRQQASLSRREILDRLSERLNQEDARTVCFDLNIEYDDLPGEGRAARLRELVMLMERRGRIPDLLSALNQLA